MPGAVAQSGLRWVIILDTATSPRNPLLSEEEAARQLGVKPATLQIWRSTRRYSLAYVKVGRNVRYRQTDVDAFIEARRVAA